jgi:excisionase family DNA binding protein
MLIMVIRNAQKLNEYLTIGEAATFLGVSCSTLRNWDRAGKVTAARHPANQYRLYNRMDLESLLLKVGNKEEVTSNRRGKSAELAC